MTKSGIFTLIETLETRDKFLLIYALSNFSVLGIILDRQWRHRPDTHPLRGHRLTHRQSYREVGKLLTETCTKRYASQRTLANSHQGDEEGREIITSELSFKGKNTLYTIVVTSQGALKSYQDMSRQFS